MEYLPLRFVCEVGDIGDYATSVPRYVNPAAFLLGLAAAVCFTVAALDSGRTPERAGGTGAQPPSHPRAGRPSRRDSSSGGPLPWPRGETRPGRPAHQGSPRSPVGPVRAAEALGLGPARSAGTALRPGRSRDRVELPPPVPTAPGTRLDP
ncbi:hypothetical protein ACSHWO_32765 [Streptomyces sp. HUAS TT3]|uniref:hypothetical protein n=1 Tax=Streptomyces sp. HUAS TT3 TaxID=3447510 RepID=UPI003F65FE45